MVHEFTQRRSSLDNLPQSQESDVRVRPRRNSPPTTSIEMLPIHNNILERGIHGHQNIEPSHHDNNMGTYYDDQLDIINYYLNEPESDGMSTSDHPSHVLHTSSVYSQPENTNTSENNAQSDDDRISFVAPTHVINTSATTIPAPIIPQQEAQRLLPMNHTAREEQLTALQQRATLLAIYQIKRRLRELDRRSETTEIARLTQSIQQPQAPQAPQTPQQSATLGQKITKGMIWGIGAPFNAISYLTGGPDNEPKKKLAAGFKQHETYADLTKILGQDSLLTGIDQIARQNLPANEKNPMTLLKPISPDTKISEKFGNDAAFIGMTRDIAKSVGGLLLLSDNLKKLKGVYKNKKDSPRKKGADFLSSSGELISAITYSGIVISQGYRGIQHHLKKLPGQKTTFASGAVAAVKLGGKLGGTVIPTVIQGGLINGSSLPFDIGKAVTGVFTGLPKLNTYIDAGLLAYQKKNFGGYKSWGKGVKNLADLTKSVAGAIKDISSLASVVNVAGAQGTQIVAGGAVAPSAAAVVGGAEMFQAAYKFRKAYKNSQGLDERIRGRGVLDGGDALRKLKEIQKKKMKRAAINTVLGALTSSASLVGFVEGTPRGLLAATIMGSSVGGFEVGQWGIRKLNQKMRDKGFKYFDHNKTTEGKKNARSLHAASTVTVLESSSNQQKELIFSSMGLNENKKDSAVQDVYNDVLKKYRKDLNEEIELYTNRELQTRAQQPNGIQGMPQARNEIRAEFLRQRNMNENIIQILEMKGNKSVLKQEVSWDQLSGNYFPDDFARLVKKAAIDKALKKR